jgi:hypothetical protein
VGAFGGLGDQIRVSIVSDSRLVGLETMLRIALEGPQEKFNNIIEEEIPLWEGGTKHQFLHANPSRYMSSPSDIFCSITSIVFSNSKDVD